MRLCVVCLLARLWRAYRWHRHAAGSRRPQIICCSATISNPAQHYTLLTGGGGAGPLTVISGEVGGHGRRQFVVWDPPLVASGLSPASSAAVDGADDELGGGDTAAAEAGAGASEEAECENDESAPLPAAVQRVSALSEAARLLSHLVAARVATICFARTRRAAEILSRNAVARLGAMSPHLRGAVACYRGGYAAAARRQVESSLGSGELLGAAARARPLQRICLRG